MSDVVKKSGNAVAAAAEAKAAAASAKKTGAVPAADKGTAVKKTTAAKETSSAKKTTTAKKATAKKTSKAVKSVRKPTAKSLLSKATIEYNIEFQDRSVTAAGVAELAVKAYVEKTGKTDLKKIELFIQPENGVAYYAVDGQGGDEFQVGI